MQNCLHFSDDIFKCIFLNENIWISINISLKFLPKGQIDYIPALVQIMARRRPGDKPFSEHGKFTGAYMHHSASSAFSQSLTFIQNFDSPRNRFTKLVSSLWKGAHLFPMSSYFCKLAHLSWWFNRFMDRANLFFVTRILIDWSVPELTFGKWAHFWKSQ